MEESTISLQGKGSIHVVPDVTRITINIRFKGKTYAEVYEKGKENSEWIRKILEYNKKPGTLAKSVYFDVSEHNVNVYDDEGSGEIVDVIQDGFDLSQRIKIDIPIDNVLVNNIVRGVGKFIPNAQVQIGFTVQDPRPSQLKMLKRAVSDAKEKATIMAEAAGAKLGKVRSINYNFSHIETYSQARNINSNEEAKASTADSLDITPEDMVISDSVSVEFELINQE